jgi:cell wall-associated NlpC family hydrolase
VEQALRSIGKSVGDLAPTQFYQYGTPVSSPQPGDLMISAGHVGVYIGGGQAISSGMNGVNETIVHPASWLTGSTYVRVNAYQRRAALPAATGNSSGGCLGTRRCCVL